MQSTREQFNADLVDGRSRYSSIPTENSSFKLYCSNCHGSFYSDKDLYEQTVRAMEEGIDNPFLCDDCRDELDESQYLLDH